MLSCLAWPEASFGIPSSKVWQESETVTYRSYSARGFRVIPSLVWGQPDDLWLEADFPSSDRPVLPVLPRNAVRPLPSGYPAEILPATVFVDARGFDPWWFAEDLLLQKPFHDFFAFASEFDVRRAVSEYLDIGQDTPKSGSFPPGLHVPMVASHQGPGAPNLMALSWMSDQILQRYLWLIILVDVYTVYVYICRQRGLLLRNDMLMQFHGDFDG